jgi:DNA-binding NarL/FixJ family response regulator/signal transduction histidine kinase
VSQIWEDERPTLSVGLLAPNARSVVGRGGALIWLAFVVFPVINAIGRHESVLGHGLAIAGAVLFVTAYVALVLCWRRRRSQTLAAALFAVLLVIAVALTAFDHSGWGFLFIYCGACAAMMGTPPLGSYGVALCSVLAAGVSALGGASGGTAIGFAASTLGIGLLMLLLRDLRIRNQELVEARAELARLAVARERERFARDLHDLLGHSLSVIALKAELAGRLLPEEPVDASREIADVENVARTALGEVREAVSGYRQPTLDGELAGARLALSTAGIHVAVDRTDVALDPEVEAVLSDPREHDRGERRGDRRRGRVDRAERRRQRAARPCRACEGAARPSRVRALGRRRVQACRRRAAGHLVCGGAVIRVLIAEDQGMVRGALASLLALEPDIEVVAQVARGDEVLAAAFRDRPDVALLDIEMPGASGLDASSELARELPDCRVLILTTFGRPGYLRRAMEGGASGFLLKDAPAGELAGAIRRAVTGERIVDPGLAAAALAWRRRRAGSERRHRFGPMKLSRTATSDLRET